MKTQAELKNQIDSKITESFSLNGNEFELTFFDVRGKKSVEIIQWTTSCGGAQKYNTISLTEQNLKDVLRAALKFKKMIKNAKKD